MGIGGTILVVLCVAGCDWFEAQPEENLPPETELVQCGAVGGVNSGGNVKFVWTGSDIDGSVISYQYSYDDLDWVSTPDDSTVIESVALGSHTFEVRAVDDKGEADPDPAKCAFVAGELVARSTLVEFLTTNTCRNCPTAEAALDSLLADFGSDRLAVIAYHDLTETDGLATGETVSRINWYTDYTDIPEGAVADSHLRRSAYRGRSRVGRAGDIRIRLRDRAAACPGLAGEAHDRGRDRTRRGERASWGQSHGCAPRARDGAQVCSG